MTGPMPCNVCGTYEDTYEVGDLWWCAGCASAITKLHVDEDRLADQYDWRTDELSMTGGRMNLAQDNFERALESAAPTLSELTGPAPTLKDQSTRQLEKMAWDLDAIQAAIRLELSTPRRHGDVDLG